MGKSLAGSPIQGEVVPQDKPPDRYVVRSVEVNERREGTREVSSVLYDDLDLNLDLDLLKARMKQLDEKELAEARAAAELERSRRVNKDYFDQNKRLRPNKHQLSLGDLVLLFNSAKENSRERKGKLADNWFGPYRVREVSESGYYKLAELDGTEFRESFAGNRLMKFFPRSLVRDGRNGAGIGLEDADRLGEHAEALEMMDSMEKRELHD
jgi:hypothetical protein